MNVKAIENGEIYEIPWKKIREHEVDIIQSNLDYGAFHGYTDKEMSEYEREAYLELHKLRKYVEAHPNALLKIDEKTERFVPSGQEDTSEV